MLFLEDIRLINFKNYEESFFRFSPGINCLLGNNGSGKTNLLDAIHYLCLSKSAFATSEAQHIRHGETFLMVQGRFSLDEKILEVDCSVQTGKGKMLRVNKKEYPRISEHIGRFPCVLMAPYDSDLIREGSEMRRRFFDGVLSQTDPLYLQSLISYNHLLKQRNSLLRHFVLHNELDSYLLDTYDQRLAPLGQAVFEKRKAFLQQFTPLLENYYSYLAGGQEGVQLLYQSQLEKEDLATLLARTRRHDLQLGRSSQGIHKDDFLFHLGSHPLVRFGSQGQQKSYLIALRLAQFDIIRQLKGFKPLLLLDDIFDKLDDERIHKLIDKIAEGTFGQVFISDARPERSRQLMSGLPVPPSLFSISGGKLLAPQPGSSR